MHRVLGERLSAAYSSLPTSYNAAASSFDLSGGGKTTLPAWATSVRERFTARQLGLVAIGLVVLIGLPLHGSVRDAATAGAGSVFAGLSGSSTKLVVPRATNGQDVVFETNKETGELQPRHLTLTEYLDYHFPTHDGVFRDDEAAASRSAKVLSYLKSSSATRPPPGRNWVWLTLADEHWLDRGTTTMARFVDQMNEERAALPVKERRHTALVTLCLDDGCVARCKEHDLYCYGGFEYTRPPQMLRATWPKVKGLSEILLSRSVFFVDSDVFFRYDPYAYMEPLMKDNDLLVSENDALNHFNTGWMWLRKSNVTSQAWQGVIERDMAHTSRDQVNFNEILGTAEKRKWSNDYKDHPLTVSFKAKNGLRVHVVRPDIFRAYHFIFHLPQFDRFESVFMHATCADNNVQKVTLAKAMGYWNDIDGYYSRYPRVLTVPHMTGTKAQVSHQLRILLAAAHYTNRLFQPPAYISFTDIPTDEGNTSAAREFYSAFPFDYIEEKIGDEILEANFVEHAIHNALKPSVLEIGRFRAEEEMSAHDREMLVRLSLPAEIDVRHVENLRVLVEKIESKAASRQVVSLINFDFPALHKDENWRVWRTPENLQGIKNCGFVGLPPKCTQLCRNPDVNGVSDKWPALSALA